MRTGARARTGPRRLRRVGSGGTARSSAPSVRHSGTGARDARARAGRGGTDEAQRARSVRAVARLLGRARRLGGLAPLSLYARIRRQMPGRTSLIFDEVLRVQIRVDHRAVWEGGPSPLELIAWLIGPPLVMWAAWLWWVGRRHRREEGGAVPAAMAAPP